MPKYAPEEEKAAAEYEKLLDLSRRLQSEFFGEDQRR